MVCRLLFSALRAAKSCDSKAAAAELVLVADEPVVDTGTLATVEEDAVDAAAAEDEDDVDMGLGSLRLLRGTGLGLIRAPAAESSLPSEGGDTVRCGMDGLLLLLCEAVAVAAPGSRCRPSRSI